ncbi:flagellar L-ring protein precursor [bacterium BMS3Bbin06]|nr:flagellar L-ring protein precursor [bacterium BMS3Abin08]GBE35146.1 flagellar L-ring protein precursor [bacterium BMS3Bbin06]HDO36456.1 flagellar basal body L-ring protein FlgH [Nitrospirota bacterium]HDY70039.1 flagellar basal body L-ring protein FlgH [Nitrospirota bacterium]
MSGHKYQVLLALLLIFSSLVVMVGCASTKRLPPPSPQYISKKVETGSVALTTPGSIYVERASLFEDRRARRLNDLVTVLIVENVSGSKKAETKTGRDSSLDAGVKGFFGAPLDLNLSNLYGKGNALSPSVSSSIKNDFAGTGTTSRQGTLTGTITARVIDVLPNGNLVIESRKEITLNFEKQVLVLKGIIRPEDISTNNTIESTRIALSRIFLVGEGVIDNKQSPGWLGGVIDRVWPF